MALTKYLKPTPLTSFVVACLWGGRITDIFCAWPLKFELQINFHKTGHFAPDSSKEFDSNKYTYVYFLELFLWTLEAKMFFLP